MSHGVGAVEFSLFPIVKFQYLDLKIAQKINNKEILTSLIGFMIAGYDTTSSTLSFCLHVLATHPEEIGKLQDEIDSLVFWHFIYYYIRLLRILI
jgi:cytochrome P450